MSTKVSNIIEELKSLTLIEAAELVKEIENTFEVDASQSSASGVVMMPNGNNISSNTETEEQTEFDIELIEVPAAKKIAVLKVVRSLTGLGLKEAKTLVESAPKILKEAAPKETVEDMKSKLEEAGAKVEIR